MRRLTTNNRYRFNRILVLIIMMVCVGKGFAKSAIPIINEIKVFTGSNRDALAIAIEKEGYSIVPCIDANGKQYVLGDANYNAGGDFVFLGYKTTQRRDYKGDLCADAEQVSAFRMWTPIKDYQRSFDGRGFSISGIYYDSDAVGNHGLFAKVDGQGKVKGLRLLDSYFRGSNHVGSICGENNGEISRCYSNATVWSDNYAGGIVSKNSGKLNHSWFDGHVSAIKADIGVAGGLVGYLRGSIDGCLFTGRLSVLSTQPDLPTDDYRHGVLVGATSTSDHSSVINSFATAGKELVIYRSDGLLTTSNIGFLTAYQFESGEACWLLNGGVEKDGEHPVWRQTIGKDLVPNYYNSIVKYDPDLDFFFNYGMPFDPTIAHLTNSIRRGVEQDVIDRIVHAIIDKK